MARSIVTIEDLSNEEIDRLFDLADKFLEGASRTKPYRVHGRLSIAEDSLLSTLFYEPSTRTRFSFESAMLRLGGHILSSADPTSTSAAKGESLADTVRVVENYADIIVLRHPNEGAARVAADFTDIPVINAGDGTHEHPTQTLCDLYTLRRERKQLKGLVVLLCGDLKHGRTIHSLVYALARFGAHIMPLPTKGMELPDHVQGRLEREFNCLPYKTGEAPCDVVYVTPDGPHRPALLPHLNVTISATMTAGQEKELKKTLRQVDVFYVTRFQKERVQDSGDREYRLKVDKEFLKERKYDDSRVLHPLPRVSELAYDMDSDPRAVYFKQASYGVPVRMALLTALLGRERKVLGDRAAPILAKDRPSGHKYPEYSSAQGITCPGSNCITKVESERPYLVPRFWVIAESPLTLRCVYCENETQALFVGNQVSNRYGHVTQHWKKTDPANLVLFRTQEDAEAAHFQAYSAKR